MYHFADDLNLLYCSKSLKENKHIIHDLKHFCQWLRSNKISLKVSKPTIITFKHLVLVRAVFHTVDHFWARENWHPKIKKQFLQDKLYSLNAHAHYFTVFIYVATWRAAKLGILPILHSQTNPDVAKTQTLTYVYSMQVLNCFLWVPDHNNDHTSLYYGHPKKFSVLPPEHKHMVVTKHMNFRVSGQKGKYNR